MLLSTPPLLAAALVYGLTPAEATAWATALGTVATVVVGVLENLIRKLGGAILDAVRDWSSGVDEAITAIDGRFAAVEAKATAADAELASCRKELVETRGELAAALARIARLEAVVPQVPSPGEQP